MIRNVLWDKHAKPHIIDWEAAGLVNPGLELIGFSLEWAGIMHAGRVALSLLRTFIKSYLAAGCTINPQSLETFFYGWLGNCLLGWLELNLRRTLQQISKQADEIILGKKILQELYPTFKYLQEQQDILLEDLHKMLQN